MNLLEFKKSIQIYRYLLKNRLKTDLEYRTDFFLNSFKTIFSATAAIILIEAIYGNISTINGWGKEELYFLYGMFGLCRAIANFFVNGLNTISSNIKSGELDKFITKPLNILVAYLGGEASYMSFGDILVNIIIILYSFSLGFEVSILLITYSLVFSQIFLFSFLLFIQTLNFYTLFPNTAYQYYTNILSFARVPTSFYNNLSKTFFIYGIPIFITGGIIVSIKKQEIPEWSLIIISIIIATLFWGSLKFWNQGLKKYTSVSS